MNARQLLINVVVVLVLLAIGGGIAYESYQSNNYVSTDNAQVTIPVIAIAAQQLGVVSAVTASVGEKVSAGQALATLAVPTSAAGASAAGAGKSAAATATPAATRATKRGGSKKAGAAATVAAATAPTVAPTPAATATATGSASVASPVSGVVSALDVSAGQSVAPGQTIVQVAEPDQAMIVANIPETAIRNVVTGQSVNVTIDAFPGTTFSGRVEAIQPATQASLSLFPASALSGGFTKVTQLVPVWITFDDQGDVLYNGLSASVSIHTGNGSL